MDRKLTSVKEHFLEDPLQNARSLCEQYNISLDELRLVFLEIQNDKELQRHLESWGPGDGYCIRVMRDILNEPSVIKSIYSGRPVYPTVLELHLGTTCPCACVFCYNKGETKLSSECSEYCPAAGLLCLTSNQILSIVEAMVEKGCKSIYFSGGLEPFSTRTTVDVLRGLPSGPIVRIYTNGVPNVLSDDVLKLAVVRASQIRFSIHAATPKTYAIVQMPHRPDGEKVFHEVIHRVKRAVQIQHDLLNSNQPAAQIGVTFFTVPANHLEIEQAARIWAEAGINFFDISNDVLTDQRTKKLSTQERERMQQTFERIRTLLKSGEFGKMKIRPSRENVQNILRPDAGKCHAPLYKAVIDPYGVRWSCCMRANPAFQQKQFQINHAVKCGEDFIQFEEQQAIVPQSSRTLPLSWHCTECTEFEYVANLCIKKLLDDLVLGVQLSEQPFVPESLTLSQIESKI